MIRLCSWVVVSATLRLYLHWSVMVLVSKANFGPEIEKCVCV